MNNKKSNRTVAGTDVNEVQSQNQQSQQNSSMQGLNQNQGISGMQQQRSKNQSQGNQK